MKHRLFGILCLCLIPLIFLGCAEKKTPQRKVDVFYCAADGGLESGSALVRYTALVKTDADLLHEALSLLNEVPEEAEGAISSLCGIRINTYTLENGELRIVLSQGYKNLSSLQKTLAKSCLTLTLCGLEEVETLSILEEDRVLESGLTRAILMPDSLPEGTGVIETSLWLPNMEGGFLTEKTVQVDLSVWMDPAEGIVSQILEEPVIQHCLKHPVKLRSLAVDKGVCTLDFEKGFLEAEPINAAAERLFLFSLIDSLTERDDINRIRFLCEGKTLDEWLYMDLSEEFQRENGFTETEFQNESNRVLTFYLGSSTGKTVPVKIGIPVTGENDELIGQTISAFLELKELWGYRRLIPASTTLLEWELSEETCVLHLSDDFHHSMYGEEIAAAALTNTLIDSCNIRSVSLYTESGAYENGKMLEKDREWVVD